VKTKQLDPEAVIFTKGLVHTPRDYSKVISRVILLLYQAAGKKRN